MGEVDQWASIHPNLLNQITKRLYSYDDYLQLRLVCKQWNFKLPKIPNGIKAPWLLLPIGGTPTAKEPFKAGDDIYHITQLPNIDEEFVDTSSLDEKGIYHLKLAELQYNLIRGSCHGWLIIVSIYEGTIRMLNPLTKVYLDLPPISTLPDVIDDGDECTFYIGPCKVTEDIIAANKFLVWKVVINSAPINDNNNDFMAVAIYGACSLAFYKPNNKRWLKLPTSADASTYFQDVIFFQEKIYAVDDDGQLYEFDTNKKAGPVGIIHEAAPPSDVVTLGEISNLKYLIGCADGSLLMVVRHLHNLMEHDEKRSYETIKFDIYKLEKSANTWSRITSLGNYVLVIGFNASVQMLADDFSNCKGNQIFFTDNFVEDQSLDVVYYHNIGIFNLEDESCQTVLSDVNFFCPPVWIFP